jgi:DNA-directed RNA polymerase subunit K/omega
MDKNGAIPITNYEKTRLIGVRATQISQGAKIFTDIGNLTDPILIAEKEYLEGVIPICIIRNMPNGDKIRIRIRPAIPI